VVVLSLTRGSGSWSQKTHTQLHGELQHVPQNTIGAAVPSLKQAVTDNQAMGFVATLLSKSQKTKGGPKIKICDTRVVVCIGARWAQHWAQSCPRTCVCRKGGI
jgi:hypothetical protein